MAQRIVHRAALAGLHATLEVTETRHCSVGEYATALQQCWRVVIQTDGLVEALLQIARLESGQIKASPDVVDANRQMQRIWHEVASKAENDKPFELRWLLEAGRPAWANPALLDLVLRNLFSNALGDVNAGGLIELASAVSESKLIMTIANSGSQVAVQDVQKVFDRFWRGSRSRSQTGTHFGLGLSVAQGAAQKFGATLLVQSTDGGRFCVTCSLPLAGTPGRSDHARDRPADGATT